MNWRNIASRLVERGCQIPTSMSARVTTTGGVSVGGTGVSVGPTVAVGGGTVAVGGMGVEVGGMVVDVGGMGVAVGVGAAAGAQAVRTMANSRTGVVVFMVALLG